MFGSPVFEWAFISQPLALSVSRRGFNFVDGGGGRNGILKKKMGVYFTDTGLGKMCVSEFV